MLLRDQLLPEFDLEMASTRRMLEAFPEGKLDYQPHPKSQTLQQLVSHIVNIPAWIAVTMDTAELDFAGGDDWKTPQLSTTAEVLKAFDANIAAARAKLAASYNEAFAESWTMRAGEKVFFTQPKGGVLRGFVFSHLVHHRAQLGVYYRLLDIALSPVYGPTADAPM